jgi:hypothetical protein
MSRSRTKTKTINYFQRTFERSFPALTVFLALFLHLKIEIIRFVVLLSYPKLCFEDFRKKG